MKKRPHVPASSLPEPPAHLPAGPTPAVRTPGDDGGLVALGWWSLLGYLSAGMALEALHGLKVGWYLDVGQETVRLMLRLGHAHGALLALVLVLAGMGGRLARPVVPPPLAVGALKIATLTLPVGFWLGAIGARGGDPGPGIVLAPLGAVALFVAVARLAVTARRT